MSNRIFIGGLPEDASRTELEREFEYFGRLKDVWVARNPPGFGFIVFDEGRDADDAVREMDGKRICGSRIRVELARGTTRGGRGNNRGSGGKCYTCGRFGHSSRECRSGGRIQRSPSRSRTPERRRRRSPPRSRSKSKDRSRSRSRTPERRRRRSPSRSRSKSKDRSRRDRSGSKEGRRESKDNRRQSEERDRSKSKEKRSASPERNVQRERSKSRERSRSRSRSVSAHGNNDRENAGSDDN